MQSEAYLGGGRGSPGGSFPGAFVRSGFAAVAYRTLEKLSSLALSGLWLFSASSVHVDSKGLWGAKAH